MFIPSLPPSTRTPHPPPPHFYRPTLKINLDNVNNIAIIGAWNFIECMIVWLQSCPVSCTISEFSARRLRGRLKNFGRKLKRRTRRSLISKPRLVHFLIYPYILYINMYRVLRISPNIDSSADSQKWTQIWTNAGWLLGKKFELESLILLFRFCSWWS